MPEDTAQRRPTIAFDHHSPQHARTWPQTYQNLRQQAPRAWTESYGGYWIATRYDDIIKIAQHPEQFFVEKSYDPVTGAAAGGVAIPPNPAFAGIPNESDSPKWDAYRNFLNHWFGPKAVEERRQKARQFAAALIDQIIEKGEFDIVDDLTSPLPALVTMDLFGFPLREWRKFADPFHKMVYTRREDPQWEIMVRGLDYYQHRLAEEVEGRRKQPKNDLIGYLANGKIDGLSLTEHEIKAIAFNVLAGGIDTTTGLTSNTLLHLSRHPEQRQRLIENPELLPKAREEFLRFFSPIHGLARNIRNDTEINGWRFGKNDRVLLCYASANRDEKVFDDPETVKLDRMPNRHIAFGAGQHRCIGSFFARMMFEAMIMEVLNRLPDYKVNEAKAVPYATIGEVNGWVTMPATFTPGRKVGSVISEN